MLCLTSLSHLHRLWNFGRWRWGVSICDEAVITDNSLPFGSILPIEIPFLLAVRHTVLHSIYGTELPSFYSHNI